MSNSRFLSLHEIQLNARKISHGRPHLHDLWHETLADQAEYLGGTPRQRMKLIARELASRLHSSITEAKSASRSAIKQAGVSLALRTSRKLVRLAEKIEQKAHAVERKR